MTTELQKQSDALVLQHLDSIVHDIVRDEWDDNFEADEWPHSEHGCTVESCMFDILDNSLDFWEAWNECGGPTTEEGVKSAVDRCAMQQHRGWTNGIESVGVHQAEEEKRQEAEEKRQEAEARQEAIEDLLIDLDNDAACASDILDLAELMGWKGDNGWESSDNPDDDRMNCELADANEDAALEFIAANRSKFEQGSNC